MWVKHLSSLQFLTYVAFFAVVVAAICKFVPGKAAPVRETPYPDDELYAHDRKTAKYFVAGGFFLVLGSLHTAVKNLPWLAEYLARTGYAGHLVRDLSNTHVTIVGGGTLLATGLCWLALPRIVGRPLASEGLAQCAFWFTAIGLAVFYVSLIGFLWFMSYTLWKPSWKRTLTLWVFGITMVLAGVSRIYLGEHWPSDVFGSYLLGTIWLWVSIVVYNWGKTRFFVRQPVASEAPRGDTRPSQTG